MESSSTRTSTHAGIIRAGIIALAILSPVVAAEERTAPDPPPPPGGAPADDVASLRREIGELRALVLALQRQVDSLMAAGEPPAPEMRLPPETLPPEPAPPETAPAPAPQGARSLMNPAISAVFLGAGQTSLKRSSEDNGFSLSEAEIAFQSVVDPYAKVDLYLTFPDLESAEVEEGTVTTLSLPASLQLKGGRYKSSFGKWNTLHPHSFYTVDRPDVLEQFFGDESLTSDGLSLSVLVPNRWDLYIDSVSEVGTAREGNAFNSGRSALTYLQRLSLFLTTGASSTLELGASASWGFTGPTQALLEDLADPAVPQTLEPDESLSSAVQGVDITWKWRPPDRNVYRSFLWQTEVLRSHREVEELTPALTLDGGHVTSLGGYTYAEVQLARRWRTGVRADLTELPDDETGRLWAASAVVRFHPSEFQELRFQVRRSRLDEDAALRLGEEQSDTRLMFEWIPVIGAHGAHKY